MDIFYVSLLSLFVIVISFSLQYLIYKSKSTNDETLLPPGRTGWPIIGESFECLVTEWKGHPEKIIFDSMSKFLPIVFRTTLVLEDSAVLCGAQGNKFLFSNENKLVQVWWPASEDKSFPSKKAYKSETVKMRKMLPNFFKPEALQRYVPIMDVITRRHFAAGWEGKEQVVTYELIRNFAFWLACKIFDSIDDPEWVRYLSGPFKSTVTGVFSIPIDLPGTPFRRGINVANFIRKELVAIVKQRKIDLVEGKATPTQDILSHMILFRDEERKLMGEHDIADKILVLLIGGHDTASSTGAFIVKYLAALPKIYNFVYKEHMEIAKSTASGELLNWEDLSKMKNGYSILNGWKLYRSANSTHKNSKFYTEPPKSDPSRFEGNDRHLSLLCGHLEEDSICVLEKSMLD